jgi:hypothetical protein
LLDLLANGREDLKQLVWPMKFSNYDYISCRFSQKYLLSSLDSHLGEIRITSQSLNLDLVWTVVSWSDWNLQISLRGWPWFLFISLS